MTFLLYNNKIYTTGIQLNILLDGSKINQNE